MEWELSLLSVRQRRGIWGREGEHVRHDDKDDRSGSWEVPEPLEFRF